MNIDYPAFPKIVVSEKLENDISFDDALMEEMERREQAIRSLHGNKADEMIEEMRSSFKFNHVYRDGDFYFIRYTKDSVQEILEHDDLLNRLVQITAIFIDIGVSRTAYYAAQNGQLQKLKECVLDMFNESHSYLMTRLSKYDSLNKIGWAKVNDNRFIVVHLNNVVTKYVLSHS